MDFRFCQQLPGKSDKRNRLYAKRIGGEDSFGMDSNGVDEDFVSLFGLKILAGRNFINDDPSDRIIITRFAADRLGYAFPEVLLVEESMF